MVLRLCDPSHGALSPHQPRALVWRQRHRQGEAPGAVARRMHSPGIVQWGCAAIHAAAYTRPWRQRKGRKRGEKECSAQGRRSLAGAWIKAKSKVLLPVWFTGVGKGHFPLGGTIPYLRSLLPSAAAHAWLDPRPQEPLRAPRSAPAASARSPTSPAPSPSPSPSSPASPPPTAVD